MHDGTRRNSSENDMSVSNRLLMKLIRTNGDVRITESNIAPETFPA
jgi:hypothetical protein